MNSTNGVEALSALAQDTRLAVFRLLVRDGGATEDHAVGGPVGGRAAEGLCAGVIAARLKIPPATLSFHLAKLEHAGLIKARRKSLNIFYRADRQGIRALLGFLIEDCCQGRPELCGARPPETASTSSS
jgi:DNA-binding transcriptional ArsR family regulator